MLLRELALTLKKVGVTAAQCAAGFRVAMMMSRLGVIEDNFESFMADVYNRSNNLGLTSESIASYLTNLIEFSKTVPFSQIPSHIHQKTEEKKRLEEEIKKLEDQIAILQMQKSDFEGLSKFALEHHKITKDKLKWYSDIKEELGKYGIPVDDISKLAAIVNGMRQLGYDVQKVVNEFSNLESLRTECYNHQVWLADLKGQCNALNEECSHVQQMVNSCNHSLSIYGELDRMRFGLKELKLLRDTISEIAHANNIPADDAVQRFFKDINEQYDDKLGFESKTEKLRVEVNRLNQEEGRLRTELLLLPLVGPALVRLTQRGIKEEDIVAIAELFKMDSSIEETQLLIDEVRKHGGIKSTIKQLSQQAEK